MFCVSNLIINLRLINVTKPCLFLCLFELFEIICWKSNGHKLPTSHSIQNSPGQSKGNVKVQECVLGKLYQTPGGEAVIFKRGIFTGISTSYVVRGTLDKKEPPNIPTTTFMIMLRLARSRRYPILSSSMP